MSAIMAKRTDISVKINADVYRIIKTVAAWKGIPVSDYLSEIAGPPARRDMARMSKEAAKEAPGRDEDDD